MLFQEWVKWYQSQDLDFLVGERESLDFQSGELESFDFMSGKLGTPNQIDQYQKELEQVLDDFGQDV